MSGFVSLVGASTAFATLLAVAFARYAKRPAYTFVVVTAVLTVISFVGPLIAHHATTATRVVLELTHVVAAAIVIPVLARRLPRRNTRGELADSCRHVSRVQVSDPSRWIRRLSEHGHQGSGPPTMEEP